MWCSTKRLCMEPGPSAGGLLTGTERGKKLLLVAYGGKHGVRVTFLWILFLFRIGYRISTLALVLTVLCLASFSLTNLHGKKSNCNSFPNQWASLKECRLYYPSQVLTGDLLSRSIAE